MALRLDGYVRVSRIGGREGDGFIAPDVQRDQIAAWAKLMDAEIVAWHEDLDYSGGNTKRPGFQTALERIATRQTNGLVVARIDRFARNAADGGRIVQEILDMDGVFASAGERIDPTTEFGKFGLTIMFAMAELELARIRAGWAQATERAISRGIHGHAPFGYIKPGGKGTALEPDPDTAHLIPHVFQMRASGEAWAVIARWLDSQGRMPKRGSRWTRKAVENIIHNRAYLGEARYGKHVNPVAHEPIVGPDLFDAAQRAQGRRPPRGDPALLSGLVRCAGCRHRLHAATVGERGQRVYRCRRQHGSGVCPAPVSVTRALLDEYVEREFLRHYGDLAVEGRVASEGLTEASQRVADAEAELVAYRDNTAARDALDVLGAGHFEQGLQVRAQAVLEARQALERARREAAGIDLAPATAIWDELDVQERRRVLTEGVDTVVLRRADVPGRSGAGLDSGRIRIFWRGEAPRDLPGPGIRVELRGLDW